MIAGGVPFLKGHGTENDFILLPDRDGTLEITADRRSGRSATGMRGIGADGVIRVAPAPAGAAGFFMDYRNADGSFAEMCGNGARVFARYLVDRRLATAGDVHVRHPGRTTDGEPGRDR